MNLRHLAHKSTPKIPPRCLESTWVTKEGVTLLVHEMDTSHIQNCIKLLQRGIKKQSSRRQASSKVQMAITNWLAHIVIFEQELNYRNFMDTHHSSSG